MSGFCAGVSHFLFTYDERVGFSASGIEEDMMEDG
jgi:hypothetical protein